MLRRDLDLYGTINGLDWSPFVKGSEAIKSQKLDPMAVCRPGMLVSRRAAVTSIGYV